MAAHACAFGPECAVGQKARRAIAEMQLTSGEARRMIEQSGHGVLVAIAGCLRGMECGRSAAAVGGAATAAVVTGIVGIIVSDATLTVIFDLIGL